MNLRYDTILFDLDETLISVDAAYRKAYVLLARRDPEHFREDDEQQYKQFWYLGRHFKRDARPEAWEPIAEAWKIETPYDTFWQEWLKLYASQATPFPWSEPLLTELKRLGVKIGIVTS